MSLILDPKDDIWDHPYCTSLRNTSRVHLKPGGKQIARRLKSRPRSMAGRLRSFPPVHMRGVLSSRSLASRRKAKYPSVVSFHPFIARPPHIHPMLQQHRQALSMAQQAHQAHGRTIAKRILLGLDRREITPPAAGF
jgi:hypothetical protein